MREDRCAICKRPIPPRKQNHEICRGCIKERNWNPSLFGYFPERKRVAK